MIATTKASSATNIVGPMTPPVESEANVIGSILFEPDAASEPFDILDPNGNDFSDVRLAAVWRELYARRERGEPLELAAMIGHMRTKNVIPDEDPTDLLMRCAEGVATPALCGYYARTIRAHARRRRLANAAGSILDRVLTGDETDAILDGAEKEIMSIAMSDTDGNASTDPAALADEVEARLLSGAGDAGLTTGFSELDLTTGGLHAGELIIVAARPSIGKTAFAMSIAEHLALDLGKPVAFFSLEMSKQQLAQRLVLSRAGVNSAKAFTKSFSPREREGITAVSAELRSSPLHFVDDPALTVGRIRSKARRLAHRLGICAIFIDYLQLISSTGHADRREQEVSQMSRGLKLLAREMSVPVVCLSQLNRMSEMREGHRPRLSDLRESGAIEQDADVVLLLHRADYYARNDPAHTPNGVGEIDVAKQRNGPTRVIEVGFSGELTRFTDPRAAR